MVVYMPHRIFICCSCEKGVDASSLLSHAKKHNLVHHVSEEQLRYVIKYYGIRSAMSIPAPEDKIPVPYLTIHDGFQCPFCDQILFKEGGQAKHLSDDHRGRAKGKPVVWKPLKCQTLFPVPTRIFEVVPPSPSITTAFGRWLEDNKDNTDGFFDSTITSVEVDAGDVTPFLKYIRWHQHLSAERQDPMKGEALVKAAEPRAQDQQPFKGLQSIVVAYYKQIRSILLNCEHNINQYLLGPPTYVTFS